MWMAEAAEFHRGRHAGLLVPLFSLASGAGWGLGEIPDLPRFAGWLRRTGLDFVQLLPVNEMEEGQNSPYSALSAMAIDPVFVALGEVPEFLEAGGASSLAPRDREALACAKEARAVDFRTVRAVKALALHESFALFRGRHRGTGSGRDVGFRDFAAQERWWLDDYALFRALHDENRGQYWRDWDPALRDRDPAALEAARQRLEWSILYYEYVQWLAHEQWQRARRDSGGIGIFGDFPFMVSGHSADVWARQHEFRVDASVGTPPDAFSEAGQDWGLPACRWDVMEANGFEWLQQRARRCAELYDGYRIDHLVGFYRTYVRERDGRASFVPPDEPSQLAQGERLMRLFLESGPQIIAEDLGTVPDFVRESLDRLGLPGLKVLRWERFWHEPGQPFRDPAEYPAESVAISGTHDTDTLADWWDGADVDERRLFAELPGVRESGCSPDAPFSPAVRDAFLRVLFRAASRLVILPIQDVFGWRDRINVPGVVNEQNWTWRLPWAIDDLDRAPDVREREAFLAALCRDTGRSLG
jgi:4-alpha-glucanotransferase